MDKREERERIKILQTGSDGFSLLELLIVLFLIGLMLALSFPDLRALYDSHLFDKEVVGIKKVLLRTYYFSLDSGKIATVSLSNDEIIYPKGKYKIPEGFVVDGEKTIIFYPDGRTSGATWKIKNDGYQKILHIRMFTGEIEEGVSP